MTTAANLPKTFAKFLEADQAFLAIDQLQGWQGNPEQRTAESTTLLALTDSLRTVGQASPIAVIKGPGGFLIVDGHRRAWAARTLGWPTIWGLVYHGYTRETAHELVALLNLERQAYVLNDYLNLLYQGQMTLEALIPVVPERHRAVLRRWAQENLNGETADIMRRINTPWGISQAGTILKKLGWPKERRPEVLRWMAKHGPGFTATLRHVLRAGYPPAKLAYVIETGGSLWDS